MSSDRLITMTAAANLLGIHLRTLQKGISRYRSYGLIDLHLGTHARRVQESSVTFCIQSMVDERRRELGMEVALK